MVRQKNFFYLLLSQKRQNLNIVSCEIALRKINYRKRALAFNNDKISIWPLLQKFYSALDSCKDEIKLTSTKQLKSSAQYIKVSILFALVVTLP